jgi:hypothetical protein
MTFVVSLERFTPPARSDGVPYTSVRIEEAATSSGPWAVIDTQATAPDADPEYPATRDLTTTKATLAEGWYRVTWVDLNAVAATPSDAVQNRLELAGGTRPTVADVASKVRARTRVKGGGQAGTFNTKTNPTADDVEALIDEALDEVLGKVREPEAATDYERRVRGAVALYTAILIELSYYPEQVGSGKSPAATYQALYASRIKALIAEGETGEVQGEGGTADSPADAAWTFPVGVGGLIGWRSRWR